MVTIVVDWQDAGGRRAARLGRAGAGGLLRPDGRRGHGGALKAMGDRAYTASGFTLAYDGFVPEEEGLREALTSTGNGYFCVRGSAEWEDASDVHYPGTYAHGVYNRESTILGRHPVPNEDLVNLPRCWSLKLCLEGEEPVRLANVLLLSYRHSYDVRHAVADA